MGRNQSFLLIQFSHYVKTKKNCFRVCSQKWVNDGGGLWLALTHKYPGTYLCMLCVGEKSIYDLFCHNFGRRRQQLYREHQFKNEPIEQENESRMKQRTTHSVWPDGQIVYSTVEHLEPLKFAQLHVNLPKYRSTLCQILNSKFSRNGLRFLWLYQSGKIFPNPVTLLMHSFIWILPILQQK